VQQGAADQKKRNATARRRCRIILSVFLPPLASINISTNSFIRFIPSHGFREKIGLLQAIHAAEQSLKVRHFIDEHKLKELLHDNHVLDEISLWPRDTGQPPFYSCDSGIICNVAFQSVTGLAFVFCNSDAVVKQLHGMSNMYRVILFSII
jgi:hypothetical protein